jgi:hypothetical protein
MDFRLVAGEWNHPRYAGPVAGVGVDHGHVSFTITRATGGPGPWLVFAASLVLSAAIFIACWLLFKAMVFMVLFIPALAMALLRPLTGGPKVTTETAMIPLQYVRNVGGGGDVVAFGIDLPTVSPEIAVLLRMTDAEEAERLRIELQQTPAPVP